MKFQLSLLSGCMLLCGAYCSFEKNTQLAILYDILAVYFQVLRIGFLMTQDKK